MRRYYDPSKKLYLVIFLFAITGSATVCFLLFQTSTSVRHPDRRYVRRPTTSFVRTSREAIRVSVRMSRTDSWKRTDASVSLQMILAD